MMKSNLLTEDDAFVGIESPTRRRRIWVGRLLVACLWLVATGVLIWVCGMTETEFDKVDLYGSEPYRPTAGVPFEQLGSTRYIDKERLRVSRGQQAEAARRARQAELDKVSAKAKRLDDSAADVARRLVVAMETVREVLVKQE